MHDICAAFDPCASTNPRTMHLIKEVSNNSQSLVKEVSTIDKYGS